MADEWIDNLNVGDKVLVSEMVHLVERITPTKQIKVSGIERRFINGCLKRAMRWDSDTYLREWTQSKEDGISARNLRDAMITKINRVNLDIFTDSQLKILSDEIDEHIKSETSLKRGDIVTFDGRRRHHNDPTVYKCKVLCNPFMDGTCIYVNLDHGISKTNITTVTKED